MRAKPLVSIVIIFLDAEKFIHDAIESVFAQTYDNWELLLVDDGSTDTSPEIARYYVEQYASKVRYLAHEGRQNRGMSASRNLGISQARGEYIAFLDADDVWYSSKLAQQVAILEAHPEAAMVYGPAQRWHSWTGDPEDSRRDSVPKQRGIQSDTLVAPPRLLPLLLHDVTIPPLPSGMLVRSAVVERTGGFEENFRGMFEDLVFVSKLCLAAPVFVASECWYKWRQHPESCCTVALNTGHYYAAWSTFLNWLEEYLSRQQINDPGVWRALQKELWPYRHPLLHRLSSHARHPVGALKGLVKLVGRRALPTSAHIRLRALWQRYRYHEPAR